MNRREGISAAEVDRLKREDNFLARIERLVPGLRPASGDEKRGPCPAPNCGASSAFHYIPKKQFAHCFACGGAWDPIKWIMDFDGATFPEAIERLGGEVARGIDPAAERRFREAEVARKRAEEIQQRKRREYAAKIWAAAVPIAGTPAERYLIGRGLAPPFPPSLRFAEKLNAKWFVGKGKAAKQKSAKFPALIAGVQTPRGGFQTIHRIYLEELESGEVVKNRTMPAEAVKKLHGSPGAGAIRLGGSGDLLALAEGVETGLAVLADLGRAGIEAQVWATISAGQMLRIEFAGWRPRGVLIFGDHDKSKIINGRDAGRAGQRKAAAAVERFRAMRIPASWCVPVSPEADWLDVSISEMQDKGRAANG